MKGDLQWCTVCGGTCKVTDETGEKVDCRDCLGLGVVDK